MTPGYCLLSEFDDLKVTAGTFRIFSTMSRISRSAALLGIAVLLHFTHSQLPSPSHILMPPQRRMQQNLADLGSASMQRGHSHRNPVRAMRRKDDDDNDNEDDIE